MLCQHSDNKLRKQTIHDARSMRAEFSFHLSKRYIVEQGSNSIICSQTTLRGLAYSGRLLLVLVGGKAR